MATIKRDELMQAIKTYGIEKDNLKQDVADAMELNLTELDTLLNRYRVNHNFRPKKVTKLVATAIRESDEPACKLVEKFGISYTTVFNLRGEI